MLDRIIRFSLNYRLPVVIIALLLIGCGVYAVKEAEVDVFPDLNAPTVAVMTEAPGMAAGEVERLVTYPVETALNGASGVRRVRSSSTAGFSVVWVEFDWDVDPLVARQTVAERITPLASSMPPGVGTPMMGPQSSILGEVMIIGLTADTLSTADLRSIAEWTVKPRLLAVKGVAQVSVIGGAMKEYRIELDPARMLHYGVTLADVREATSGIWRNVAGGAISEFGNEYLVRGITSGDVVGSLDEALVKMGAGGMPVRLSDIADIREASAEPRIGAASVEGTDGVIITVTKQPREGTVGLTERLDDALASLAPSLPAGVNVSADIFRQSDFIDASIGNVRTSLLEGAAFVVVILFLFFGNVRTTLISLVTIPLALLTAILTLRAMGETLNTMSLGGLAIAIGSLVDDAIVDVENVWRHLRDNRRNHDGSRRPITDIVFEASREVRMPILNSTLIIIVSFLPLFFLNGMEGRMLMPLGVAFITALMASTLVALTLTPVMCSYMLASPALEHSMERESRLTSILKRAYRYTLLRAIGHGNAVLAGGAVLLVAAIATFFTLGRSFLPPFNEGSFTINISSLPGISLEESDSIGRRAEQILLGIPEIITTGRKTGRAELDEHALGVNVSEIEAPFRLSDRSHAELADDIRHRLSAIAGANIEIGQPISHRIDAMLSGTRASIAIKIFGDDLNTLFLTANQVSDAIADIEGVADLSVEQQIERPEVQITPRPLLLGKAGVSLPEFNDYIAMMIGGEKVGEVYEGERSVDLIVRGSADARGSIEALRDLPIAGDSTIVLLSDVADIRSDAGPYTIGRENVGRRIIVSANASGRDVGSIVDDMKRAISRKVALPEGYRIEFGGQFESEKTASRTLALTSLLSILAIWLLLWLQFRDVRQSLLILLNLPFALIGGIFVLRFTDGVVSIPAIIGFISLFGIATRNGCLLVARYNLLRESGLSLRESVVNGSLDRMNPILMTALTSALALIPLAMRGDLPGNEIQSPMACVILGGLISSTILNAYLIPIIFLKIERRNNPGRKSLR
ncbi:MAG: CusA/CzcA family heavy metal efflux RND transporter [Muribaculaceae bacterium]|nr:CusA/CzcA family heavy metal efflux RND transporter [Muribaculaceae bacterium]